MNLRITTLQVSLIDFKNLTEPHKWDTYKNLIQLTGNNMQDMIAIYYYNECYGHIMLKH